MPFVPFKKKAGLDPKGVTPMGDSTQGGPGQARKGKSPPVKKKSGGLFKRKK